MFKLGDHVLKITKGVGEVINNIKFVLQRLVNLSDWIWLRGRFYRSSIGSSKQTFYSISLYQCVENTFHQANYIKLLCYRFFDIAAVHLFARVWNGFFLKV